MALTHCTMNRLIASLGAVRRSRMRTTIHYVVIKPDSRPDGTAIRDHARVRVCTSSRARERRCATNCESE